MATAELELVPRGPFALAASARFLAGWPPGGQPDAAERPIVRLGFLVDDWSGAGGVALRQDEDGVVRGELVAGRGVDPARVRVQAARVLSLDRDASGWAALGAEDRVLGALQEASGWLRPVNFHSPYEALAWFVLAVRVRETQARALRDRLAADHGDVVDVDGRRFATFPAPHRVAELDAAPGLTAEKVTRLRGVARAALEGRLDAAALLADPEAAVVELQALRGVGPFSALGAVLRGAGAPDLLATPEPRVRAAAERAYGRTFADDVAWAAFAERWRPWRSWAAVLLRASG